MALKDLKIFKLNRLRFDELYEDATKWLSATYGVSTDRLTTASPFGQLLTVVLNLGRMILFYISDSVENLSMTTAYKPSAIKGLATLTGHNPSLGTSARAAARLYFINTGNLDFASGQTVAFIPNKTTATCTLNGRSYIMLFGADAAQMTIGGNDTAAAGNYINCWLIQGKVQTQQATGTGLAWQTYNFAGNESYTYDDQFINVYVNGERWPIYSSFMDMGFNQKGVVVRNSMTGSKGGLTICCGDGTYGQIIPSGATVICESIVSDGIAGNVPKETVNAAEVPWVINGSAYLSDGTQLSINDNFRLELLTDAIFGCESEPVQTTQKIAPYTGRAMVLATATNYKYFFGRMNMFSTIEVMTGRSSEESNVHARIMHDQIQRQYNDKVSEWQDAVSQYGESSREALALYEEVDNLLKAYEHARQKVQDTDYKDNTVYALLIPDLKKRISSSVNYFTCPLSAFTLSAEEQANIIQMIEDSGQKIITMETRLVSPKTPRFAINASVKLWEGYNETSVYADALDKLSDYFISMTRKDMVPVSDITALLEGVEGIDSVKVWFDADENNSKIYGKDNYYGIDSFGDVVLTRPYVSGSGSQKDVRDILPLFRGGFTSPQGIEYSDVQSKEQNSAFNMYVTSYTQNNRLSMENPID